jgi:hypothetical protein
VHHHKPSAVLKREDVHFTPTHPAVHAAHASHAHAAHASHAAAEPAARMLSHDAAGAMIEVTCSCGKKIQIRCEYDAK